MEQDFRIGDLLLYKNNQLIAFNKPATLPVQDDQTGDRSLQAIAEIYAQRSLHLLNRIDRPASGVTLFARNAKAAAHLSEQFRERQVKKTYLAIVGERPPEDAGQLRQFLLADKGRKKSIISDEAQAGYQAADLDYRLIGSSDRYFLLEIDLLTGRQHQIRAQLAALGCPIQGDNKYGFKRGNRDRSIALHAWKLAFTHPTSGAKDEIIAGVPEGKLWEVLMGGEK